MWGFMLGWGEESLGGWVWFFFWGGGKGVKEGRGKGGEREGGRREKGGEICVCKERKSKE